MAKRHYQNGETRRRQVAEAALETIAAQGVEGFTTRIIAQKVGISDGTVFRHFESKADIVHAAIVLLEEEMDAAMVQTGNPRADLETFFRHRSAFIGAEGSVGRLIFSENLLHLAGDAGRERLAGWRQRNVAYLLTQLGALHAEGALRDDLDVPAMSMFFQGALLTFAMQASLGRSGTKDALNARIDHAWKNLQAVLFRN